LDRSLPSGGQIPVLCGGIGVEGVQLFARFEADGFARGDVDFSACAGIAADAGFAGADAEDAKTAQLNAIACGQCLFEALEDRVDCCFSFSPWQACPLDDVMHDILLDQCSNPLIEENLEPIDSGKPEMPSGEMLLRVGDVVNLRVLQYHKQLRAGIL
jgi:hypothetical protein